jgi:hypothetical protein
MEFSLTTSVRSFEYRFAFRRDLHTTGLVPGLEVQIELKEKELKFVRWQR